MFFLGVYSFFSAFKKEFSAYNVNTLAGTGTNGPSTGSGVKATAANLYTPRRITQDTLGNLRLILFPRLSLTLLELPILPPPVQMAGLLPLRHSTLLMESLWTQRVL